MIAASSHFRSAKSLSDESRPDDGSTNEAPNGNDEQAAAAPSPSTDSSTTPEASAETPAPPEGGTPPQGMTPAETPASEDSSSPEEAVHQEATPEEAAAPAVESAPATGTTPVAEDTPADEAAPVADDVPVAEQPPAVEAPEQAPVVAATSPSEVAAASDSTPTPVEAEAPSEAPAPTEAPASPEAGASPPTRPDDASLAAKLGAAELGTDRTDAAADFVRGVARGEVPDELTIGLEVRGVVAEVGDEDVLIDVGGKFQGHISKVDLADTSGKIAVELGDSLDLVVARLENGTRFERKTSPMGEAISRIAEAFAGHAPLDGEVISTIKGGYEVRLSGVRAFCPGSQAGLGRNQKPESLVGKTVPFLITKFEPSGRSIVISRKKLVEKERKKKLKAAKSKIVKDARFTTKVVSLQAYGAFCDLGGIQGLLHVTEISHSRVNKPSDVLKVGQSLDVVVLDHDEAKKKISLSAKALTPDPWKAFAKDVKPGMVMRTKVLRIVKTGVILEFAPGVEALLPPSEVCQGKPPEHAKDKALIGTDLDVVVLTLDARRHRLGLLRAPEGSTPGEVLEPPKIEAKAHIRGLVERVAPFGVFVRLAPGKTGLLHASETGTPPGTDLEATFPPGSPIAVEVIEVSEEDDRIRLTKRTAQQRAAQGGGGRGPGGPGGGGRGRGGPRKGRGGGRAEPNPAAAPNKGGFASFGDLLRSSLGLEDPKAEEPPAKAGEARAPEAKAEVAAAGASSAAAEGVGEAGSPADPVAPVVEAGPPTAQATEAAAEEAEAPKAEEADPVPTKESPETQAASAEDSPRTEGEEKTD